MALNANTCLQAELDTMDMMAIFNPRGLAIGALTVAVDASLAAPLGEDYVGRYEWIVAILRK